MIPASNFEFGARWRRALGGAMASPCRWSKSDVACILIPRRISIGMQATPPGTTWPNKTTHWPSEMARAVRVSKSLCPSTTLTPSRSGRWRALSGRIRGLDGCRRSRQERHDEPM